MDVFAHALWTAAAARYVNSRRRKKESLPRLNLWRAAFWGVFPDLFAFVPVFLWGLWGMLHGEYYFGRIPRHGSLEPISPDTLPILNLTHRLYSVSHSLIVFALIMLAVWAFLRYRRYADRRILWEMGGWLLHILIDIPSHSYNYFPTPVLWPFSEARFDGISWAMPWFMILNYGALFLVYLYIWRQSWKARVLGSET